MVHFQYVHSHEKYRDINNQNPKMAFSNEHVILNKKGHNAERDHKRYSDTEQIKKYLGYIRKSFSVRTVHSKLPP